jgi:FkbM family methyltransferase
MPHAQRFARISRKWRQIASSELSFTGKFAYSLDLALGFFRSSSRQGHQKYRLKGGATVALREGSTDRKVFDEVFLENTYGGLAASSSAPRGSKTASNTASNTAAAPIVLIDLGANIGLSAIALARQLRPAGIVAVEPDGANFAMLQHNLRLAGLSDRSKTIRAFAGAERGFAELVDSGNGAWGMRMGAPARAGIPVWRIEDLVALAKQMFHAARQVSNDARQPFGHATSPVKVVLKCDIEGAEAQLFQSLTRWEHLVERVVLELHTEFLSVESFRACLDASRYAWRIEGEIAPGALLAVIALERGDWKLAPQTQHAAVS